MQEAENKKTRDISPVIKEAKKMGIRMIILALVVCSVITFLQSATLNSTTTNTTTNN